MFHMIVGKRETHGQVDLICNEMIGIEVIYQWFQKQWIFYLHPILDDRTKTILYYSFDTIISKQVFASMLKITWIWPKTAFWLAHLPQDRLKKAIDEFDIAYISSVPWIWPKWAKKILVQLKDTLKSEDVSKLVIDPVLLKTIIQWLKQFWYTSAHIHKSLWECPHPLIKDNTADIIKRLVQNINI